MNKRTGVSLRHAANSDGRRDQASVQRAVAQVTEVIAAFPTLHQHALLQGRRAKLGLQDGGDDADDAALADDWLSMLHAHRIDFTLGWRRLADAAAGDEVPLRALFDDPRAPQAWLERWRARSARDGLQPDARAASMRAVSPLLIPRNHLVEEVLAAASDDADLEPFERLLAALRTPFDEVPGQARYAEPAPAAQTACYRTFCGT